MLGQNLARFDCFVFPVEKSFTENSRAECDAFGVVQQKPVFEMGARRFARIQKAVDFDVIRPRASVSLPADLGMLQRFHICRFLPTTSFFIFSQRKDKAETFPGGF